MTGIEILYKIYLDSDNSETKEKKPYYYMKKDCQKEITKETLKSFLVEDGYNPNYFELIKDFKHKIKIIDLDSNSRPYAVMINNIATVWGYQSGLQDAYLVYEIIVEGGYTQ